MICLVEGTYSVCEVGSKTGIVKMFYPSKYSRGEFLKTPSGNVYKIFKCWQEDSEYACDKIPSLDDYSWKDTEWEHLKQVQLSLLHDGFLLYVKDKDSICPIVKVDKGRISLVCLDRGACRECPLRLRYKEYKK